MRISNLFILFYYRIHKFRNSIICFILSTVITCIFLAYNVSEKHKVIDLQNLLVKSSITQYINTNPNNWPIIIEDKKNELFTQFNFPIRIQTLNNQEINYNSQNYSDSLFTISSNLAIAQNNQTTALISTSLYPKMMIIMSIVFFIVSHTFIYIALHYLNRKLEKQTQLNKRIVEDSNEKLILANNKTRSAELKIEDANQTIQHLVSHDQLTDLPTRPQFEHIVSELISKNGKHISFAILIVNLVKFQDVNESLGYDVGDTILKLFAGRIQKILPSSSLICRLNGDKFCILLQEVDQTSAAIFHANNILKTTNTPLVLDDGSIDVSANTGIAIYPPHGKTILELIRNADAALQLAKRTGRNIVTYTPHIDPYKRNRLKLRSDLRLAIENGELTVAFQPKYDIKTQSITSVEALARWNHPELGNISPDQFIPLAENSGLIHPLTGLIFNISLNQISTISKKEAPLGIAINVSSNSLHDLNLPIRIKTLLDAWNISPNNLIIEITESAIMSDPKNALRTLNQIAEMGIQVSIDDFGTGYSSLTYIKKLPVQEIKIDKSFVTDMNMNENDNVIVRATIDMAHDLGLKVTAEGVEDKNTWTQLEKYGCDHAQGFYMSKPVSLLDLTTNIITPHISAKKSA